jgi:hypothetical protein
MMGNKDFDYTTLHALHPLPYVLVKDLVILPLQQKNSNANI